MVQLPRFPKNSAAAVWIAAALPLLAVEIPAGTELQIRLTARISTQTAHPSDPVQAVVIAPVMSGDDFLIPAGAIVRGTIDDAVRPSDSQSRSTLLLKFNEIEIDGTKLKLAAQLSAIDNAREKIDGQGQINGILASETATARLDAGINKVTQKYSGLGGLLNTVKSAVLKPADTDIDYDSGVEMTLKLTAPLTLAGFAKGGPAAKVQPVADVDALAALIAREPFQTVAQSPPKPSDITNLILIGSEDQVRQAFTAAGWHIASRNNTISKFETFRALAEDRGYEEAPVSVLLLDGKPPDLVFEKLNNTFEQRHHLRVWRRPAEFRGQTVWAIAATHDTGISFSEANRTFIHKIDGQIDRERAKVVNDLIFAGQVRELALIGRPSAPKRGENATGDSLETDGRIAAIVLN